MIEVVRRSPRARRAGINVDGTAAGTSTQISPGRWNGYAYIDAPYDLFLGGDFATPEEAATAIAEAVAKHGRRPRV